MARRSLVVLVLFFGFWLIAPEQSAAHRIHIFAQVENGKITGRGYFSGGAQCKNCRVMVFSVKDKQLARTKTDDKGSFILEKLPGPLPLKLVIQDLMGHRAEFVLKKAPENNK